MKFPCSTNPVKKYVANFFITRTTVLYMCNSIKLSALLTSDQRCLLMNAVQYYLTLTRKLYAWACIRMKHNFY